MQSCGIAGLEHAIGSLRRDAVVDQPSGMQPSDGDARLLVVSLALAQALAASPLAAQVPTPESHFGFRIGSRSPARRRRRHRGVLRAGRRAIGSRRRRRHRPDHRGPPHDRRDHQRPGEHPEPRADSRREPAAGRSAHAAAGRGAPHRRHAQGGARDRQQHSRVGDRRHPGGQRAALLARHGHRCRDAGRARQRRRHSHPVAQSGRPSAGRRLVRAERRTRRSKARRCRGSITSTPATTSIATRS